MVSPSGGVRTWLKKPPSEDGSFACGREGSNGISQWGRPNLVKNKNRHPKMAVLLVGARGLEPPNLTDRSFKPQKYTFLS